MNTIGVFLRIGDSTGHKFIESTGRPKKGLITEAAVLLANHYLQRQLSANAWRKEKNKYIINYEFPAGTKKESLPVNYESIRESVSSAGIFDPDKLNLPPLGCMWMDHAAEMKQNFHEFNSEGAVGLTCGDLQEHHYGKDYPILPVLQREGHLYTSFQPQLIRKILKDRKLLFRSPANH